MLINTAAVESMFVGFKTAFNSGFAGTPDLADRISMKVVSSTTEELYPWLGLIPGMREWIGPRVINSLKTYSFSIVNKTFESTVEVPRTAVEDDRYGVYAPAMRMMGMRAMQHKQQLLFRLLKDGFTANAFDGQYFFDTDHPVEIDGAVTTVANTDGGSGTPWFLLDTSKPVMPFIYQERLPYELVAMNRSEDPNVFFNDAFLYGTRARMAAGYGLWQLAWGSKQTLNAANYAVARAAMMGMKSDGGQLLGVTPTVLVVPPSLESAGRQILNSEFGTGGVTNEWKGTAELLVVPWLI